MYFLAGKSWRGPSQATETLESGAFRELLWLSPSRISHSPNTSFLTVTAVLLSWWLFGCFFVCFFAFFFFFVVHCLR